MVWIPFVLPQSLKSPAHGTDITELPGPAMLE
jgi:hypothetical protein